jgi:hypothetical protein
MPGLASAALMAHLPAVILLRSASLYAYRHTKSLLSKVSLMCCTRLCDANRTTGDSDAGWHRKMVQ